uniref:Uncharacterized protein LOC114333486 n=1 Tax=Diabrotica virgifera virgifera TaxID=50390 RepID=A0A6P7FS99_DIAVI
MRTYKRKTERGETPADVMKRAVSAHISSNNLLINLRPFLKAGDRKANTKGGRKRRSTAILTDTPIKSFRIGKNVAQEKKAAVTARKEKRIARNSAYTSTKTAVDNAKKDLFKRKIKNKRPLTVSSDEYSDQDNAFCLVCMEPNSNSRPGEQWIERIECNFSADFKRTDGNIVPYRCQNCDCDGY